MGGGPGDDSITAKGGAFDDIDCGEGEDTIFTFDEGLDFVSSNAITSFRRLNRLARLRSQGPKAERLRHFPLEFLGEAL